MELDTGQVAVVTGAASGIGRALAAAFGSRGLAVMLSDVDPAALEATVAELVAAGCRASGFRCDVSDVREVEGLRDHALATFGRIDVICNNAGVVIPFAPLWETTSADWEWIQSVNLRGVFNGIRTFVPLLLVQGSGHVVNTASMAGVAAGPNNGPYTASKHAVVSLTETLAADLERAGVDIGATVLCCGVTRTGIFESGSRDRPSGVIPQSKSRPFDDALDPADVARLTIDAMEAGRLYAFTTPGSEPLIRARVEHVLRDAAMLG